MDNAQKAIMIGVGLFITIIIISSVLLISNMGTNLITSAQSQLSGITKGLQNQITAAYDGKTLTGAEVIAAYQQYESSEMSLIVRVSSNNAMAGKYVLESDKISENKTDDSSTLSTTAAYPGGLYYHGNYTETGTRTTLTDLQKTSGSYAVNASKTFYSSILKDKVTDTVICIIFIQRIG